MSDVGYKQTEYISIKSFILIKGVATTGADGVLKLETRQSSCAVIFQLS